MQSVESFVAYDDEGTSYSVVVTRSRIDTSSLDGGDSIEGLATYRLATGGAINKLSETEYRVVATGRLIKRR